MNLASIVPPSAAPAPSTKTPAGSGDGTGAAGFLAVLATEFAATAPSGATSSGSADTTGDDGAGLVAQDVVTLAALASRSSSAALPLAVPAIALPVEGGSEGEVGAEDEVGDALTAIDPAAGATTDDLDAGVVTTADVQPASDDARSDVVAGDEPPPTEVTGSLTDAGPSADVTDAEGAGAAHATEVTTATDDAPPTMTTDEASPTTTAPVTTTRSAAGTGDGASTDQDVDGLVGQRAEPAAPAAGRGHGRADEALARTRVEGGGTVRSESIGAPTPAAPGSTASAVRIDAATPSAAAQRVLDLVTQLEDAPPPRVVVIDTGEVRVRLGLDAGTVRMTVLGPLGETGEELLREVSDALEAGGFGTELDRGADGDERGGDRADREDRPAPTTPSSSRRPAAAARAGLQL